MRSFIHAGKLAAVGFVAVMVAATQGCASPPTEATEVSTAKLLAPKPLVTAKASAATTKAFGIVEWRMYRGRGDVLVTGYDANKRAVKGFAVGFDKKTSSRAALVHVRALDGSRGVAKRSYGGSKATSGTLSLGTKQLLALALADLRKAAYHLIPPIGGAQPPAGTPQAPVPPQGAPLPPPATPAGPGCGADLSVLVMAAIQCVSQANGDMQAAMQCVLAAQGALSAGQSCNDPNAPPMDQGDMCADPYGQGQGDPYGQGDPGQGDPYGQGQGDPNQGDPYGQGQGDPNQGDPYGQGQADPYGDPNGGMCGDPGGMADQAGQGQEQCPSCPEEGGYGDIQGDPNTGEATGGDPYGDMGGGDPYGAEGY